MEGQKHSKKSAFRKIAEWLHLWLGLLSGIVVFIVCFTGGLWVFRYEIGAITEKHQFVVPQQKSFLPPSVLVNKAQAYFTVKGTDSAKLTGIIYGKKDRSAQLNFSFGKKGIAYLYMNPYDGRLILDKRKPDAYEMAMLLIRAGHRFLWLPQKIGSPIVGSACLIFLIIIITGLVWWYPQKWTKRTVKKSFTLKRRAGWKRLNIDLHNVFGFYASILLLFLTITGIYYTFGWFRHGMYRTLTGKVAVELKEEDPLSDTTVTPKPATTIALDHIWKYVTHRHADFGRIYFHAPQLPKDTYQTMVFFGDGTIFYNKETYFHDQATLKSLPYVDPNDKPYAEISAGERAYRMNFDIHTGQILGLPTKILAFLACMVGASLPVTGTIIWYNRKWGKKKRPSKVNLVNC
ncbi:PepSY domain-containing protein [Mucilaginibacter sp. RS28]|uniref:PepSY domain-containing protein n=1 Tax=Mucilaginibacter straminoryzae TaxID=2932774 RepID=A0A9X1X4V8_9SPHI|nr:PepSY-associated TM helix domain-containing protein [Mucilaginibacter straminoryzae]MCJ8208699.1 PepSY domain-containing protein [Mucilaginibacter straminoryzae]